jgi:hypothetical protein
MPSGSHGLNRAPRFLSPPLPSQRQGHHIKGTFYVLSNHRSSILLLLFSSTRYYFATFLDRTTSHAALPYPPLRFSSWMITIHLSVLTSHSAVVPCSLSISFSLRILTSLSRQCLIHLKLATSRALSLLTYDSQTRDDRLWRYINQDHDEEKAHVLC